MSVFRREVHVLLQGEIGFRLRTCVVALSLGLVIVCGALAAPAGAAEVRHYERVSPADKGDGDIIGEGEAIVASSTGGGATFESRNVFADAVGSGAVGRTTYLARREAGGAWTTRSLTPMPQPAAIQVLFASTTVGVFASDLTTALVWGYDLPGVSNDTPDRQNLYAEDTATGALRPLSVSQVDRLQLFDFLDANIWGVSADAKHVAFVTGTKMLPDAAPGDNVYKWDDGVLSVAGVLPDGSVAGSTVEPRGVRSTMSADGTRLAFMSGSQLYLHIDGRRSVWISQPEGSDRTDPSGVHFEGMTPDARHIFFVSDSPLLDADTAPGPDLYRFTESADPANDANLTLITNDGFALNQPGGYGAALVGMSDDGKRVYVHEISADLKLWEEGVGIRTIASSVGRPVDRREQLTVTATQPGNARVSPDGEWLAYLYDSALNVYSRADDTVTCVSCPGTASLVPTITNSGRYDTLAFRPRFMADDGRVFFTAAGQLVPADTNSVADVYEYDGRTRTLSLLTSGKGSYPAMFADASASGDDVFFVTRKQLVSSDTDAYNDVYDARVGAAPVEPVDSAPACDGDACQGTLSGAPAEDALGSLSFDGDDAGAGSKRPRLTVGHIAAFRGAAGVLAVRVSSVGRVRWTGRGLRAGSVKRGSAGTARLHLRLGHRARVQLKRSGRYVTTVHLTFLAADGTKATRSIRVTFRAVAKKGR